MEVRMYIREAKELGLVRFDVVRFRAKGANGSPSLKPGEG